MLKIYLLCLQKVLFDCNIKSPSIVSYMHAVLVTAILLKCAATLVFILLPAADCLLQQYFFHNT